MTNCVILAEISHYGILSLAFDVCVFISQCECVTSGACLFAFSLHTLARQSRAVNLTQDSYPSFTSRGKMCVCVCVINRETDTV